MLDQLNCLRATRVAHSDRVMVDLQDPLMQAPLVWYVYAIVPAQNTIIERPASNAVVLLPDLVEGVLVSCNFSYKRGLSEVNTSRMTNMLRFKENHIVIVTCPIVMIRASGEGICAYHGGARLVYQNKVVISKLQ